jgi:hypothetical protein
MVRSAHTGGAHDLTSEGPPTPEVETSIALLADSIAGRADILPPAFVCSRPNVGLDATWVHLLLIWTTFRPGARESRRPVTVLSPTFPSLPGPAGAPRALS